MLFFELANTEECYFDRIVEVAHAHNLGDPGLLRNSITEMEQATTDPLTSNETALLEQGDMDAVFEYAIGMENKSLEIFKNMAEQSDQPDFREFCKEMVTEERRHASSLEREWRSLQIEMEDRPAL